MKQLDLIAEAIRLAEYHVKAKGWGDDIDLELYTEALAAVDELRDLKLVAKHVCNLWINPETSEYEVDRCTHPIKEVIPVYTALAQPEQAVVPFPSFMRKRIEQAMEDAIHPKGMSVHDGKAKVHASDLHRMLLLIDSAPPKLEQDSEIQHLQRRIRAALAALQTGAAIDVVAAIEILRRGL